MKWFLIKINKALEEGLKDDKQRKVKDRNGKEISEITKVFTQLDYYTQHSDIEKHLEIEQFIDFVYQLLRSIEEDEDFAKDFNLVEYLKRKGMDSERVSQAFRYNEELQVPLWHIITYDHDKLEVAYPDKLKVSGGMHRYYIWRSHKDAHKYDK